MQRPRTCDVVSGRWRSMMPRFGFDALTLSGKHCPCPLCGGKDRFRFDNKEGRGSWICSHCGAGDGFDLLMRAKGWDFATTSKEVLAALGEAPAVRDEPDAPMPEEARKRALNELWKGSAPVTEGDPVAAYLLARGLPLTSFPADLRTCKACPVSKVPGVRTMAAMIAMVRDVEGRAVTLHRTYLQKGSKAEIENPRRLMPGPLPKGSCVRLTPPSEGALGIAEGIETALAASRYFAGLPVWAALNAENLAQWEPPSGVDRVYICADHDASYAGHVAAYRLAYRLRQRKIEVTVNIPPVPGEDWADVLLREASKETV